MTAVAGYRHNYPHKNPALVTAVAGFVTKAQEAAGNAHKVANEMTALENELKVAASQAAHDVVEETVKVRLSLPLHYILIS